jgi:hypothetical protein
VRVIEPISNTRHELSGYVLLGRGFAGCSECLECNDTLISLSQSSDSLTFSVQLHARLGEIEFMAASSSTEGTENSYALLTDAVRRFSRSIELCDDYLRGYYGLKVVRLHRCALQEIEALELINRARPHRSCLGCPYPAKVLRPWFLRRKAFGA